MTQPPRWILAVLAVVFVAGCEGHEFHPPADEDRAARADSLFDAALFDTLTWSSASERLRTGNLVFADECRRCHGPLGRGETEYAEVNEIDVPSLVTPDWAYADQPDSVRYLVFVGHGGGMPEWGVGRLTPREIDAAAAYILDLLRPEMLADSAAVPEPLRDTASPND